MNDYTVIEPEQAISFGRDNAEVCADYLRTMLCISEDTAMDEDEAMFVVNTLLKHDSDYYRHFGQFVFDQYNDQLIEHCKAGEM